MPKLLLTFIIFTLEAHCWAQVMAKPAASTNHDFAGRISKANPQGKLIRVRSDYGNMKFLRRQDRVEFWNDSYPEQRCSTSVEGRTNDYLLLRIPDYEGCLRRVHFTTGSYLHFSSPDLDRTVKVASELVEILQKKRFIMDAKKRSSERELDNHVDRVNVVNQRYEILRQKLEIEWKKELSALEEDKARAFTSFKEAEARLNEIDVKLESYRIEDHNLKLDRWSLDPASYTKK